MFKSLISVVIFALVCASSLKASAVEVAELDKSAVKVADRSQQEKNQALKQAMQDVVLKNTGNREALDAPLVQQAIAEPTAYIRQFGYQEREGQQYLQASFDHTKIINLLRQAQLPVWGKQRPLTLLWLAQENDGQRELLNDSSLSENRASIADFSQARGLPMMLPIMDLDDSMAISVNDVRGMFADQVAKASQRYHSDYFAMVSLDSTPDGQFSYNLTLYPASSEQPLFNPLVTQTAQVADVDAALSAIFEAISQYYVERYAIADSGEANTTQVTFIDITDRQQLLDIESYLRQLSAVKSVSLTRLQGITAEFSLQLFGSEEDLYRLISLEPRIHSQDKLNAEPMLDPLSSSQTPPQEYIWQGR
ncbi:DUF2066 domain-containing protein [Shewanella marisflavi]|uniref:DUF2066 domain-containing protein n=1 Tax=Shewanella marisflavi TaxID=260364 RepID=A0AAC9U0E6_9GAMM|nr:DUF2066 domain-containing protein [Shewanella marisflavi]ASJ96917.1 hypothetical protein CFF01_10175 [Shewanella marisflavi]